MVSIHDEELLNLYVDRELGFAAARELEARVPREPQLAARLESIVASREARVRTFDAGQPAPGALDQLLLSIRAARASELIAASRGPVLHHEESAENQRVIEHKPSASPSVWTRQRRFGFLGAAAACLLVGTFVGLAIDRRPPGPVGTLDTSSLAGIGQVGSSENTAVSASATGEPMAARPLATASVAVRVVRDDGKTFVFRFPDEDSADAWVRAMYDRLAQEKLESKFDFEVIPTWY
jgi:hypothetical protein